MKYSGRTQMLSNRHTIFESLDLFKSYGFDGVEICFEDIAFRLRPDLIDDRIIALVRNHCESIGLVISAVSNHMRYFFDDFIYEQMIKEIKSAKKYGTDIFVISVMNDANERVACKELRKTALERIRGFCKVAEAEGVRLALEPEPPSIFSNTNDFITLCREIDSPALCMNFDVGHAFLTDEDMLASIDLVKDKIIHGHVEDMQRGQHLHLFPGDGDMDLAAVISKLHQVGFDGYLSLDLYNYIYEDVAKAALDTLRNIEKL